MNGVSNANPHPSTTPPAQGDLFGLRPVVAGTALCIVSALGYTVSNICMRRLTTLDCDPVWAIFNKELVTVVVVGPWVLARALRGQRIVPTGRVLAVLVTMGLVTQLLANLGVQWALGIVGLAVTIPAIFGVMLTASAVVGWSVLGERVSRRAAVAIAILLVSLAFLGLSASAAGKTISQQNGPWIIGAAVAAACLAGALYSLLTVTIRHTVTNTTPVSTIVLTITGMGVVSLGPLSLLRLGTERLASTPPEQFAWMFAAGLMNLIAFLAITKGLQLTTVVHANVLNASQVAMAAIAGMMLFDELPNRWLIFGVVLTIAGILLIGRPAADAEIADQHS